MKGRREWCDGRAGECGQSDNCLPWCTIRLFKMCQPHQLSSLLVIDDASVPIADGWDCAFLFWTLEVQALCCGSGCVGVMCLTPMSPTGSVPNASSGEEGKSSGCLQGEQSLRGARSLIATAGKINEE